MASRCGVGSTSQRLVNVAWMTTASGRLPQERMLFSSSPGVASERGDSARVGNEQSLGVSSIPDGSESGSGAGATRPGTRVGAARPSRSACACHASRLVILLDPLRHEFQPTGCQRLLRQLLGHDRLSGPGGVHGRRGDDQQVRTISVAKSSTNAVVRPPSSSSAGRRRPPPATAPGPAEPAPEALGRSGSKSMSILPGRLSYGRRASRRL